MKTKEFTSRTRIYKIRHCSSFKEFKKYIFSPRSIAWLLDLYRLKDLNLFFPFNDALAASTLNKLKGEESKGHVHYYPLAKGGVGVYSFLIKNGQPFVLVLPGGAYSEVCSLEEGYATAMRLNELGYNAFIGNYRVGKQAAIANPLEDVATILRFIFSHTKEFGINEKYAVCGFSAGGHLAGCWGYQNIGYAKFHLPKPSCLFLAYPAIDMGLSMEEKVRKTFFGKLYNDKKTLDEYSIELHVEKDYPQTFLWQCENDNVLPFKHYQLMNEALIKAGVKHHSESFATGGHGLGLADGTEAKDWLLRALNFWEENS